MNSLSQRLENHLVLCTIFKPKLKGIACGIANKPAFPESKEINKTDFRGIQDHTMYTSNPGASPTKIVQEHYPATIWYKKPK